AAALGSERRWRIRDDPGQQGPAALRPEYRVPREQLVEDGPQEPRYPRSRRRWRGYGSARIRIEAPTQERARRETRCGGRLPARRRAKLQPRLRAAGTTTAGLAPIGAAT